MDKPTYSSAQEIELCTSEAKVELKVPKRVLHFSDGTIEEFSDSEDEQLPAESDAIVSPPPGGWGPWLLLKLRETGETTLSACDYVGEALASFLGITSPKYQYELEEYRRMVAEKMEQDAKAKGWTQSPESDSNEITEQPLNNNAPTPV